MDQKKEEALSEQLERWWFYRSLGKLNRTTLQVLPGSGVAPPTNSKVRAVASSHGVSERTNGTEPFSQPQ